jgi:hypothetical protein
MKPDSSTKTRWAPSRAAFFYSRPVAALPWLDPCLVALKGAPFGLLAAEAQIMQHTGDMTAMELHAAVLLDQGRDARGRPQLGGKTVRQRPLEQSLDDAPALRFRQRRRPTGREPYAQRRLTTTLARIAPAHHRTRRALHHAADFVKRVTFIQQPQRLMASRFDQLRRSLGAGHGPAPPSAADRLLHYLRDAQ